ncbi:hypothetical protein BJY24_004078 [Nocardia transvalensis]|uniref:DUF8020 domain-containing protein n=1 Tax=Nocardia transvalensis TaxID=37333 RepID=A0A7W9UJC7_9NOCA|nr:hypothetical protein [Nocardia transvalensis]MBB5915211.1 hypothetical protein [Nocardia transvalensis]
MKIRKFAATSVLLVAGLAASAGTVSAAPAATEQGGSAPVIHWNADVVGKSIVLTTDGGSLAARDNQFVVLDPAGTVIGGLPLAYRMDGLEYPVAATIDGNTATLTPSTDAADAHPVDMPLQFVDAQADFDSALSAAGTQFGLATGVGTLLGGLVGLVGGCILGAITVGALTAPIFFAGAPGGCIAGASVGVAIGAAGGSLLVGVPVGIASVVGFFQRLNTPAPAN